MSVELVAGFLWYSLCGVSGEESTCLAFLCLVS